MTHTNRRTSAISVAATAIALLFSGSAASAETVNMTFSGFQETISLTAVGTGSFTFADGLTNVGIPDLTSFSYNQVVTFRGQDFSFNFGIVDLLSFSLILDGTTPTDISLQTANKGDFIEAQLIVDDLGGGFGLGNAGGAIGVVAVTDPPTIVGEPTNLSLVGFGSALLLVAFRKRKKV